MILVVLSTHAGLASATARGRSYWETGQFSKVLGQFCKIQLKREDYCVGVRNMLVPHNRVSLFHRDAQIIERDTPYVEKITDACHNILPQSSM